MKCIPGRIFALAMALFLAACVGFGNQISRTIYEFEGERFVISASLQGGTNTVSLAKLVAGHPVDIGSYTLDANGQVRPEDEDLERRVSRIIDEGREVSSTTQPVGLGGGD